LQARWDTSTICRLRAVLDNLRGHVQIKLNRFGRPTCALIPKKVSVWLLHDDYSGGETLMSIHLVSVAQPTHYLQRM
jgi:hypothetical protein